MKYKVVLQFQKWSIYASLKYANILIDKRDCLLHHQDKHVNGLPFYIKYDRS